MTMGIKELESPVNKFAKKVETKVNKVVPREVKTVVNKLPKPLNYAAGIGLAVPQIASAALLGAAGKGTYDYLKVMKAAMKPPKPADYEAPNFEIEMPELPDYSAIFGEMAAMQTESMNALQNFDVPKALEPAPPPPPIGQAAQNLNSWDYNALRRDQYRGAGSTILGGGQNLGSGPSAKKTLLGG
jgi:hypothetical protein